MVLLNYQIVIVESQALLVLNNSHRIPFFITLNDHSCGGHNLTDKT